MIHRGLAIALLVGLYLGGAFAVYRLVRMHQLIEAGVDATFFATPRAAMFVLLVVAIAGAAIVHAVLWRGPKARNIDPLSS